MKHLQIINTAIRQHEGLYSLNDLHQASGGEDKHRPAFFLRLDTTQSLIEEIKKISCADMHTLKTVVGKGKAQGTYACKELVIAYAAWISPAFHLKVISVFLGSIQPATVQTPCRELLETTKAFKEVYQLLQALDVDKHTAAMRANQAACQVTGLDLLELTGTTHFIAEKAEQEAAAQRDHPLVEAFWERFDFLEGKYLANGDQISLNHSRDEKIMAINLVEYEAACSKAGLYLPCELAALKKLLKSSVQRKYVKMKTLRSVLGDRTVRCWLFQAGKARKSDDND